MISAHLGPFLISWSLLLAVCLAACGGDDSTATPTATATATAAPEPSPTATPTTPAATSTPTIASGVTPTISPPPAGTATATPRPTLQSTTPTPANGPSVTPTPGTVVLTPSQDNTIFEDRPVTSNGAGVHIFAGNTGGGDARRALLKFDVAGQVPAGATITSVTLELTQTKEASDAGGTTLSLHKLSASWGEGMSNAGSSEDGSGTAAQSNDATWTRRLTGGETWATPGGDFVEAPSGQTTGTTWESTDTLIADVQSWLADPNANHGWIVIGDESASRTARQFASRESPESDRPRLTIAYQ